MKSFACYCQMCRAANNPAEDLCAACGTPLMLITTPPINKNETIWADAYPPEHLLERVSLLELRMMQVVDRLGQALDLMMRQTRTIENEHLLVETLIDALAAAGVLESDQVGQSWRVKQQQQSRQIAQDIRRERALARILAASDSTKFDLFIKLVKEAFFLLGKNEEPQAVQTLERAAALSKNNAPLLTFLGEHFFRCDKRAKAEHYLRRAHALDQENANVRLLLGTITADAGDAETARKLLSAFGETNFAANFMLGFAAAAEKRFADALAQFKIALRQRDCAETNYLVGAAYAELNKLKTAARYLQKAVERDQNFADAWFTLGAIRLRDGDEAAAKIALSQAMRAQDAGAQSHALLKNRKNKNFLNETTLLFANFDAQTSDLLGNLPARLKKLLREEIEKAIDE